MEGGLGQRGWEGDSLSCAARGVGRGRTGALAGAAAALGGKHVLLSHVEVEVRIYQKAAPDAEGEKDAQARREGVLLEGEAGRQPRQGQVSRWPGTCPSTGASRPGCPALLSWGRASWGTAWRWWGQSLQGHS